MNIQLWLMRGLCLLVMIGIFLIFQNNIMYLLRTLLWPVKKLAGGKKSKLVDHLNRIFLVVTNGKHLPEKVIAFIVLSLSIFIIMGGILLNAFEIKGLIIAAVLAAMPYAYIRARLIAKQVNGSFEGEMLVKELVNQYKMCDRNIYKTIDSCMAAVPEGCMSKKALFQLAIKLNTFGKEEELREALENFVLNWDTTWARTVADNIYNAVWEDVDVLHGIENILEECEGIGEKIEKNKREGLEAEVIVKFICPLFFIILMWMAKNMMGYSWQTIIKYEFIDSRGLMLFTAMVLVASFNIVIFPVMGKQKYDY